MANEKVISLDNLTTFKRMLDGLFDAKQDVLVSGTNIKTINSQSLLGSGNISISSGASIDTVYPVGSIYVSYNATSPASLFGGTWTSIQASFLVGYSKYHTKFGTAGATGGEISHTLTNDEMPSHGKHLYDSWLEHGNVNVKYLGDAGMSNYGSVPRGWNGAGGEYYPAGQALGGGQAHNNLPPYLVVYMWRRTA